MEPSSSDDIQTRRSFNDKWVRNPSLAFKQTLDPNSSFQKWILERNGFNSQTEAKVELGPRRRILDAGCGNGRVTALLSLLAPHSEIVGIDLVDLTGAKANTSDLKNVSFENADLLTGLSRLGKFDFIYSQEVLHHTGDARRAFFNLVDLLNPSGKIAIYVYRRKAPAREFMDDLIRNEIAGKSYEEAMVVCRQITELGRRLSEVTAEIEFDSIPSIGVDKGRYTPQRLLYNFFMKCYWNSDLSFEENAVINYDWYHPQNCSRHTMDEVRQWFDDASLVRTWEYQDPYGITMHGVRG